MSVLESHSPAEFRFNTNQKHLNQLIKILNSRPQDPVSCND